MRCIEFLVTSVRLTGLSMDPHPGTARGAALQPRARATTGATQRLHPAPATILLVAIWTGLTAGFLDLGLMILKKRLTGDDFYRLGDDFRWIIPAAVGVLVLLPGAALALVACLRRGRFPWAPPWDCCHSWDSSTCCARLPLELWASLLLSGGLAVQSAWLAANRREPFLRLVHRTAPLLVGAVLAIMLLSLGVAGLVGVPSRGQLAAPHWRCPERALDRLGYGTGR